MIFQVKAVDLSGSKAVVATESPREALQSLLAFEAAKFQHVTVLDETGRVLMTSDLYDMAQNEDGPSARTLTH